MKYKAYQFTSAKILFSDGREIELNPQAFSLGKLEEETQVADVPTVSLPTSFSVTIHYHSVTRYIRLNHRWVRMPPLPPDRVN